MPLQIAVGLQGLILWVPVEKLFMTQIGFTPRTVGVMAAAYAAVVPLLEVPSGILADRWSRNQIMVCASVALLASTLLGGLSTNVATYIAAAMILGVYFALNSGTVDSIVYDAVLEETGASDRYETWIGRARMVESGAFVASALAGGVLAGWSRPGSPTSRHCRSPRSRSRRSTASTSHACIASQNPSRCDAMSPSHIGR